MESTKLGPAQYLTTREDGVRVLHLTWKLANNSKAVLFTKEHNMIKIAFDGKVGDMTFSSKEECWSYMRALRDSLIRGATVEGKAATVLSALLEKHPKYAEKVGCGVSHFKYDEHPEYTGTMCFFIVRTDGTSEDFSFRKCLDIVFGTQSRQKPRDGRHRGDKRKRNEPEMKLGTVIKVGGLDRIKEKGVEIKFRDLKEAFGVVGGVEWVEMFESHAEIRFSKAEDAKNACAGIENVKNELVDVTMLPEVDERKHFERYFASKKNKPSRHGGRRGRGRGRHGKGRRR